MPVPLLANLVLPVAGTTGAPTSGAHLLGELSVDSAGAVWVCTAAGTPGTWAAAAQGGTTYQAGGGEDPASCVMDLLTMPRGTTVPTSTAFGTPGSSAVGDAAAQGSQTTLSRSDHVHGREGFANPNTVALGTAAAAGSAATHIRSDATIAAFDTTAPSTNAAGTLVAAATGSAAVAARRDHVHGSAGALGTLGYTQSTSNQGSITTNTDLTGLSTTVTVGSGRRIKITAYIGAQNVNADQGAAIFIQEGATQLAVGVTLNGNAGVSSTACIVAVLTPSAGSHTYKVTAQNYVGGTVTVTASATGPNFILVEDIGT